MSPHTADDTAAEWTVEDLHHLRDDQPGWEQSPDQAADAGDVLDFLDAITRFTTPASDGDIINRAAVMLRAGAYDGTPYRCPDCGGVYTGLPGDYQLSSVGSVQRCGPCLDRGTAAIEPTRVIPPRGPGGRFIAKDSAS